MGGAVGLALGRPPCLAAELLGPYQGSGLSEQPFLVRRPDGVVVQLSLLLYLVASCLDGRRSLEDVALAVTAGYGRPVASSDVVYLIDNKLAPLGVVGVVGVVGGGPRQSLPPARSSIRGARSWGLPPRLVSALVRPLLFLYWPPAVVAVLVGLVAVDAWLFVTHGAQTALRQSAFRPIDALAVLGLVLVAAIFHELGHAAACRAGGARPGRIRVGLFFVWVTFCTDVTDTYRLDRRSRLRTDLGGVYFNAIMVLIQVAAYLLTGWPVLIAAAVAQQPLALVQLLPFLRLDGFYILSDLTGLPDLNARIGPALRSLLPFRRTPAAVAELRRGVRAVVAGWSIAATLLVVTLLAVAARRLPAIAHSMWSAFGDQVRFLGVAWRAGLPASVALAGVSALMIALPAVGLGLMLAQLSGRLRHKARAARVARVARRLPSPHRTLTEVTHIMSADADLPVGRQVMPPDAVARPNFRAKRGRYQRADVDRFVATVAQHYQALYDQAVDDAAQGLGDEVARIIRAAHEEAGRIRAEARRQAATVLGRVHQAHQEAVQALASEAQAAGPVEPRPLEPGVPVTVPTAGVRTPAKRPPARPRPAGVVARGPAGAR